MEGDDRGYDVLFRALDKVPAVPVGAGAELPQLDRTPEPWEGSVQATCECLSWRGSLENLERRHAEDELGETVYAAFPAHSRSLVVTTHRLLDRGLITADELAAKLDEVRSRLSSAGEQL